MTQKARSRRCGVIQCWGIGDAPEPWGAPSEDGAFCDILGFGRMDVVFVESISESGVLCYCRSGPRIGTVWVYRWWGELQKTPGSNAW